MLQSPSHPQQPRHVLNISTLPTNLVSSYAKTSHCVKSVQIRSFFWSVFSRIRTEYGISPYSVRMRKNTDQKELRIWTLFTQCLFVIPLLAILYVYQRRFQAHIFFTRHLPRGHNISYATQDLERTINKPFTGLIG